MHYNSCRAMQEESWVRIFILQPLLMISHTKMNLFFKHKSEALECFKHFTAMAEKYNGYSIKIIRTNRGGEFIVKSSSSFCDMYNIQR